MGTDTPGGSGFAAGPAHGVAGMIVERTQSRDTATLLGVQYLRGFAALAVVYYHVFSNRVAQDWGAHRDYGVAGVDVFFVISGFIMWRTTSRASGSSALDFLLRRAGRIYPAWWIALTIWIAIRFVVPDRLRNADIETWSLLSSYALAPHYHEVFRGHVWPILVPGWTLELEILFYLLFACTIWLTSGRPRLFAIVGILVALSLAGFWHSVSGAFFEDLTQPLMLEFAAGIVIAAQFDRLRALPPLVSAALLLLGICLIGVVASPTADGSPFRALTLGPAAALIVAGGIGLDNTLKRAPVPALLLLGDMSYSLYLTHPISISAAAVIWERLHLPTGSSPVAVLFVPLAIISAVVAGLLFYRIVELPLLTWLKPYFRHGAGRGLRKDVGEPLRRMDS